jgi:hypothetical protein
MMKSWPLPSKLQFLGPGDYDSLDFTDLLLPYIPRWVKENYTTHHICPVFAWKIHMVSQVDWSRARSLIFAESGTANRERCPNARGPNLGEATDFIVAIVR